MSRATLAELRRAVLLELESSSRDEDWVTPTEIADRLRLGHGEGWTRLCLTLERLVVDGLVEIERPGATRRRFRRRIA